MKNKKVALFMLPLLTRGGGAEKYFINLAVNLKKRGFDVDIVTMDKKFFKRFVRLLFIYFYGNIFGKIVITPREEESAIKEKLGNVMWIKSSFKDLKMILCKYNLIYSKNEIVDLFLLKLIGYKRLPPIIVGVHTPIFYGHTSTFDSKIHNFLYVNFFYKWMLSGIKLIHASNQFTKNLIEKKFKKKCQLIYYPYSTYDLKKLAQKYKSKYKFEKKFNIIFCARLTEQKGILPLIEIINKIGNNSKIASKICINIFGNGQPEYERLINDLQKKYLFVKYFGYIDNKYVPGILEKQNLFITPSRWEVLPFNVLEAQGMGLPVVSFNIPGPNDIIVNNKTGIMVEKEDDFFKAIVDFVDGKYSFNKNEIKNNIIKRFSPDKIYSEISNMINGVIK